MQQVLVSYPHVMMLFRRIKLSMAIIVHTYIYVHQ